MICKSLPPFSRLPFCSVDGFLYRAEAFSLMLFRLFIFTLGAFDFGVKSKKSLPKPMSMV